MSDKRPANRRSPPASSKAPAAPERPSKKLKPNTSALASGATVAGRYRIRSVIGAGGMGVVYSATEVASGHEVAIKALNPKVFTTENLRRFRREAQTAASVRDKHVCEVFYLGVEAGTPFIVMERLHGETLRRRLVETGPLSATDAVSIMIQVLNGLSAAHRVRVLHRDIKPTNVFVTSPRGDAPSVKIIDFGLAKFLPMTAWTPRSAAPPEEQSAITTTDVIPGTPSYLAPEQVAGARDLDQRVDVWAAGLTFYEMLVGRRPYDSQPSVALVKSILLRSFPPLSSLRSDLPAGFDAVLGNALAKNRDERFPSAEAFRAALVHEWARFRTEGLARGERLRKSHREPKAVFVADDVGAEDPTEIDVDVQFEPDD